MVKHKPATELPWKRVVGQRIRRLTAASALHRLKMHEAYGVRLGDPMIKELTGGLSSQAIDAHVLRKLGVKAGIVNNPA